MDVDTTRADTATTGVANDFKVAKDFKGAELDICVLRTDCGSLDTDPSGVYASTCGVRTRRDIHYWQYHCGCVGHGDGLIQYRWQGLQISTLGKNKVSEAWLPAKYTK